MAMGDRADPLLGRLIGQRYRLISRLGAGGMATVYLARHVVIERLSAIKFLHPDLSRDAGARDRFLREAKAVNRINHPNIVEITDYGEAEGLVFLVMEYIPGEPLTKILQAGPVGWRRAANIGLQVAAALGRAHQMGVIHRDLKPSNILVVDRAGLDDLVKLTDFGVAKLEGAETITTTNIALGTPGYVAPEYGAYGSVDSRADLFSLGVVLYQATVGQLPFPAPSTQGFAMTPPPRMSASDPEIPPFFDEIVSTLLQPDPDDRPRDGFEAYDLLRRLLASPTGDRTEDRDSFPIVVPGPVSLPAGMPAGTQQGVPPPPAPPGARSRGPHLTTTPFDQIAPTCAAAWAKVSQIAARSRPLAPHVESHLSDVARLVAMVERLGQLVQDDTRDLDALHGRSRRQRADMGRRLDELARRRSKTLGWAGTMAERGERVRQARDSGVHPVQEVEAMVWEEATLHYEEAEAWRKADRLAAEIEALQGEMDRLNDSLDRELSGATAKLEGRIAAMRALALEAWMELEESARKLGGRLD